MRAEECAGEYMSPLVKQDLAKTGKDGESRRVPSHALSQEVEKLELGSIPQFLAQVSESIDTEGSRLNALVLYEEVARVHGKLIIPHIGQLMATVTRSLSSSGNSPDLHQACAKAATAWVRYSVDADTSVADAGEILKEVSRPLVDLLAGNLEHVVAGAATCLQAITESEKWKLAPEDLVSEVCNLNTTALGDKSTRTVAQMQLARSLSIMNPESCHVYGARLLNVAQEVLSDSTYSWQLRKSAAEMAQSILEIVDRKALDLVLNSITQALENCNHDTMPEVRTAACEALQTAKRSGGSTKEKNGGDHRGLKSFDSKKHTPQQRNWSPNNFCPSSQDTYNLSSYTPPPASCDSAVFDSSSASSTDSTSWMKRSLMFSSKTIDHSPCFPGPPFAVGLYKNHESISDKEYVSSSTVCGDVTVSHTGMSAYLVPASHFNDPLVCDQVSPGMQHKKEELLGETELTPTVTQDHPKGKVESRFSPFEALITRSFCEADGDLMAEDEEILSGGSADLDGRICGNNGMRSGGNSRWSISMGKFRLDSQTPEYMEDSVQSNTVSCIGMQSNDSDADSIAVLGMKGCISNNITGKVVDVLENKQMPYMGSLQALTAGYPNACNLDDWISHAQYMKLENLSNSPENGYSSMKPRVLITAADFMPYTTPRRLVLSLQSQFLSPGDEVGQEDVVRIDNRAGKITDINEDAVRSIDYGTIKRIDFIEEPDMEVESSSDSGWSVRDNPIASDESTAAESSPQNMETHDEIHDGLALPRKIQNVAGVTPTSRAISPPTHESEIVNTSQTVQQGSLEIDDAAVHLHTSRPCGALVVVPEADKVCTPCPESKHKRPALKSRERGLKLEVDRTTDDRSNEQEMINSTSIFSQAGESCVDVPVCEKAVWVDDVSAKLWSNISLLNSAKRGCSKIMSIAEVVLKGSLCVVVAVPISLALATVLQTPTDYYLVPT